jgi:hypothetical protein
MVVEGTPASTRAASAQRLGLEFSVYNGIGYLKAMNLFHTGKRVEGRPVLSGVEFYFFTTYLLFQRIQSDAGIGFTGDIINFWIIFQVDHDAGRAIFQLLYNATGRDTILFIRLMGRWNTGNEQYQY